MLGNYNSYFTISEKGRMKAGKKKWLNGWRNRKQHSNSTYFHIFCLDFVFPRELRESPQRCLMTELSEYLRKHEACWETREVALYLSKGSRVVPQTAGQELDKILGHIWGWLLTVELVRF
jgi:hypothetical protein